MPWQCWLPSFSWTITYHSCDFSPILLSHPPRCLLSAHSSSVSLSSVLHLLLVAPRSSWGLSFPTGTEAGALAVIALSAVNGPHRNSLSICLLQGILDTEKLIYSMPPRAIYPLITAPMYFSNPGRLSQVSTCISNTSNRCPSAAVQTRNQGVSSTSFF